MRRPADVAAGTLDTVLDVVVWWFAAWTVSYHVALLLDLSQSVTVAAWIALAVLVTVVVVGGRPHRTARPEADVTVPARLLWVSLGCAGVATGLMAGRILTPPAWYLGWAAAMAGVAPAAVWLWWSAWQRRSTSGTATGGAVAASRVTASDTVSGIGLAVVVGVAVGFALLSAFTRRPDSDDSHLVNRALYAQVHADGFTTRDTMFADEEFESVRPDVAPSSIEPLIGVAGRATGVPVQTLTYLVVGPAVAAAGVFAVWRLARTLRVLAPAAVTAATAVFLVLDGVRHQSFGNFSFARSWQGKTVLVLLLVPLLWHYALDWGREHRRSSAVGLVAANIAAVGLSSTGLVIAPVVSVLGVVVARPEWLRRSLPLLGLAIAYPLVALLAGSDLGALVGSTAVELAGGSVIGRAASPEGGPIGEAASFSWYLVLGSGLPLAVAVGSMLAAWTTVRAGSARRMLAAAAAATLLWFGPGIYQVGSAVFEVDSVYWRMMWLAPIPLMVGLVATAGVRWLLGRPTDRRTALQWAGALALPVLLAGVLWSRGAPVLVESNLDLWVLDWDVDPGRRDAAQLAIELSDPGDVVAAPVPVGQAMALLSVDVRPVNPENRFTRGRHNTPEFRGSTRRFVARSLEVGLDPARADRFALALEQLSVDTVCSYRAVDGDPVIGALESAGFVVVAETDTCRYWRRLGR